MSIVRASARMLGRELPAEVNPEGNAVLARRARGAVRSIFARYLLLRRQVRRLAGPLLSWLQFLPARLSLRQQRAAAGVCAGCLQVAVLGIFVLGFHLPAVLKPSEVLISISGTPGLETAPLKPPEIQPELPPAQPPEIQISDAIDTATQSTQGLSNVTIPAQAIAEAHVFPAAPLSFQTRAPLSVHLIVSVTEAGTINNAVVQNTCGIAQLDAIAIAWVKQNWRYRPALRNGIPIAVDTTAILTFVKS